MALALPLAVSVLPTVASAQTATALEISVSPNTGIEPGITTVTISYRAVDSNGGTVDGLSLSNVAVSVSWLGGSATDGATYDHDPAAQTLRHTVRTAAEGAISFTVSGLAGDKSSSVSLIGTATATVVVDATRLELFDAPTVVRAGQPFDVRARAVDDVGNVDVDFPGFALAATATLTLSSPDTPAPPPEVLGLGQVVLGGAEVTIVVANLPDGGDGARFTVLGGADSDLFTLRFLQSGLQEDSVQLELAIIAELMRLSAPAEVVATHAFDIEADFFDVDGRAASRHQLSPDTAAASLTPGFGIEIVALNTTANRVTVRMLQAMDNATATIRISDQGLSGDASLLVRVLSDRLSVRAPSTVTALLPFEVEVVHVDSVGNVDTGITGLSSSATLVALSADTEIIGLVTTATRLTSAADSTAITVVELFSATVLRGSDNAVLSFQVADRGAVGIGTALLEVVGTRFAATAPLSATPGTPFLVEVAFFDANGNRDVDLHYLAAAPDTTLTVGVAAQVVDTDPAQDGPMLTLLGGVVDGQSLAILLERAGFPSAQASLRVNVQAVVLALSGPSTGTVGTAFTVGVLGVDSYGNIDADYSLTNVSVTVDQGQRRFTVATPRSLWVNIHQSSDNATVALGVVDGNLSSSTPLALEMDVRADRLRVTGPGAVDTATPFQLGYQAVDAADNVDADYSVAADDVVVTVSGNGAISRAANGDIQVTRAADGATLRLHASTGGITGSHDVQVDVQTAKLLATALGTVLVPGLGVGINISGVDSYGNVDEDYQLPQAASVELVGSTGSVNVSLARFAAFVLLHADRADDGAEVALVFAESDSSGARQTNTLRFAVDVVGVQVEIAAPKVIVPGAAVQIDYMVTDHLGNTDTDAPAVRLVLSEVNGEFTLSSAGVGSHILTVGQAVDYDTLRLTASSGSIIGTVEILVDVQADRLRLDWPPVAYIGDPFVFGISGVDRYGNVDDQWRISTDLQLAATPGSLFYFGPRLSDGAMVAVIVELPGSTEVRVVATDGALSGAEVMTMRASSDGITVTGLQLSLAASIANGELRVGSTVTLTVSGVDDVGLVDPAWLPGLDLSFGVLGGAGTVRSAVLPGGTVQIQLLRATDNSSLTLVAYYPGLSSATLDVTADVLGDRLSFARLSYTMNPGGALSLSTPIAVDAFGNVDVDYPSPPVSGRLEEFGQVGGVASLSLIDGVRTLFLGTRATDRAVVEFRYVDTTRSGFELAGPSMFVTADVLPVRLALISSSSVVVGEEFLITAQLQDNYGNLDIDTAYFISSAASLRSLTAGVGYSVYYNQGLRVSLFSTTDQATVRLHVVDGGISGTFDILADVVADRIELQLPAVVVAGQLTDVMRQPVDRFGNVDASVVAGLANQPLRLAGLSPADASANTAAGGYAVASGGSAVELLVHVGQDRQALQLESLAGGGYALSGAATFVLDVMADFLLLSGSANIREGVPYDVGFMPLSTQGSLDSDLLPTVVDSSGVLAFRAGIAVPTGLISLPLSALSAQTSATASGEFALSLSVVPAATESGTVRFTLQLPGDVDIATVDATAVLTVEYAGLIATLALRGQPPVLLNVDGAQGLSVSDALLIARVLSLDEATLDTNPSLVIVGFADLDEDDAQQIIADVRQEIERNPDLLDVSGDAVVDETDGAYLTTYLGVSESLRSLYGAYFLRYSYGLTEAESEAVVAKIETLIATVVD